MGRRELGRGAGELDGRNADWRSWREALRVRVEEIDCFRRQKEAQSGTYADLRAFPTGHKAIAGMLIRHGALHLTGILKSSKLPQNAGVKRD